MAKSYQGQNIIVSFDPRRCIHARKCAQIAPHIFNVNADGDWIQPLNGSAQDSINVANACPSGAISYASKSADEPTDIMVNTAHIQENGPLALRGNLQIENEAPRQNATLCRCGLSKRKPYCDGAHTKAGFQATGEIATASTEVAEQVGGILNVKPLKNGPLYVTGNLEVCAASGRLVKHASKTALCRCGKSKNKPFCDGTHKSIGFEADGA